MEGDVAGDLLRLEEEGWKALAEGRARAHFAGLLAEGALVLRGDVGVVEGEKALDALSAAPLSWFKLRAPRTLRLGDEAASIAYRLLARCDFDAEQHSYVSSTYLRVDGAWRLALRQETPA